MNSDPHGDASIVFDGAPLERARYGLVLLHGRGGSPQDILSLGAILALPDVAMVAPAAAQHSWWPQSFLASLETNEPYVSSALNLVEKAVGVVTQAGLADDQIVLAGFSQGACLALEHTARAGRRYRGVVAMSGGLLGTAEIPAAFPDEALYGHRGKQFEYTHSLNGLPVAISCRTRDPHIPLKRVEDSARILAALGADVRTYIQPGEGHAVLQHDIRAMRALLNTG